MITVTWNISAPGYSKSGDPEKLGLPVLEGADKTWGSLDELGEWLRQNGLTACITPCEHSGTRFYYGEGGYRYRHDQSFSWPETA
jgi:hypothetical protein